MKIQIRLHLGQKSPSGTFPVCGQQSAGYFITRARNRKGNLLTSWSKCTFKDALVLLTWMKDPGKISMQQERTFQEEPSDIGWSGFREKAPHCQRDASTVVQTLWLPSALPALRFRVFKLLSAEATRALPRCLPSFLINEEDSKSPDISPTEVFLLQNSEGP